MTLSMTAIAWTVTLMTASVARADDTEDVVVTAQKRSQKLSDVSASVTAVSGKTIEDEKIQDLSHLADHVTDFTYLKGGNVNIIAIRGLGSAGGDTMESSVGVYVDGVPISKARDAAFPLFDVDRVEVLRGPQGALFGKNTIAGVLNIESAKPTDYWTGYGEFAYGSYNYTSTTAALSGPLSPVLNMRVAVFQRHRDGYTHNDSPNRSDGGGFDSKAARMMFDLHPDPAFKLTGKLEFLTDRELGISRQLEHIGPRDRANPAFNGVESLLDNHQIARQTGLFDVDNEQGPIAWNGMLNASYRFDSGHTLTAVAGYSDFNNRISRNDALPINTIVQRNPLDIKSQSIEVRLSSPETEPLRFTTGFYADTTSLRGSGFSALNFSNVGNAIQNALIARGIPAALLPNAAGLAAANTLVMPGDGNSSDSRSWALFTEASYRFLPEWTAVGGLRYSHDTVNIKQHFDPRDANGNPLGSLSSVSAVLPNPGAMLGPGMSVAQLLSGAYSSVYNGIASPASTAAIDRSQSEHALNPSLRLEYRPRPATLLYGVVQTGFKQGGYLPGLNADLSTFGSEKATAFELGAKTYAGPFDVSAAAFRTNFRNLQVSAINAQGTMDTLNAANAISQGLELEGHYRINSSWRVNAAYAFLDAHYNTFTNAPCSIDQLLATTSATCKQDLSGKPLFNAPRHSVAAGIEYHTFIDPGFEFSAAFTGTYKSSYYTEISNSEQLKSDVIPLFGLSFKIAQPSRHWQFSLLVSNLFNKRGALMRQKPSLVADPSTYMGVINDPRMIIGQLRYEM